MKDREILRLRRISHHAAMKGRAIRRPGILRLREATGRVALVAETVAERAAPRAMVVEAEAVVERAAPRAMVVKAEAVVDRAAPRATVVEAEAVDPGVVVAEAVEAGTAAAVVDTEVTARPEYRVSSLGPKAPLPANSGLLFVRADATIARMDVLVKVYIISVIGSC
jgi:hypothetical protein